MMVVDVGVMMKNRTTRRMMIPKWRGSMIMWMYKEAPREQG